MAGSRSKELKPGRYEVTCGNVTRMAEVFEDLDAGCLCVRFEMADRVQRLDEIDPAARFRPVKGTARAVARER